MQSQDYFFDLGFFGVEHLQPRLQPLPLLSKFLGSFFHLPPHFYVFFKLNLVLFLLKIADYLVVEAGDLLFTATRMIPTEFGNDWLPLLLTLIFESVNLSSEAIINICLLALSLDIFDAFLDGNLA